MLAEQLARGRVEQTDLPAVPLDGDGAPDPAGWGGIVGAVDLDAAVEVDRTGPIAVERKGSTGSASRAGRSSANMAATWRLVVPWMRVSAQRVSQRSRYAWAASRVSKRSPFKGVACVWPIADSTFPFRSGSPTRHGNATAP
jgi:hypothetical protein